MKEKSMTFPRRPYTKCQLPIEKEDELIDYFDDGDCDPAGGYGLSSYV